MLEHNIRLAYLNQSLNNAQASIHTQHTIHQLRGYVNVIYLHA